MSTLQCANVVFEGTNNTSITYASNTLQVQTGGANIALFTNAGLGLLANSYINLSNTMGSSGYGIRDNAGVLEVKPSGGSWYPPYTANNSRGMDLLAIVTASGAASMSSATNLPSYTNFVIVFEDVNPSTNNVSLYGRFYNGAWAAGNYYHTAGFHHHNTGGSYFGGTTITYIPLTFGGLYSANTTYAGTCGTVEFSQAANTSTVRTFKGDCFGAYSISYPFRAITGGYYSASTNAMSGFQLYCSSGNISGKMRIYGYNV